MVQFQRAPLAYYCRGTYEPRGMTSLVIYSARIQWAYMIAGAARISTTTPGGGVYVADVVSSVQISRKVIQDQHVPEVPR